MLQNQLQVPHEASKYRPPECEAFLTGHGSDGKARNRIQKLMIRAIIPLNKNGIPLVFIAWRFRPC